MSKFRNIPTDSPLFSQTLLDLNKPLQGHIFACTKNSESECLQRLLFATNQIYEEKIYSVKKGDVVFLINLDTNKIYGPFIAETDGSVNTDGSYVMSEERVEESDKVKTFDKFIKDLEVIVKKAKRESFNKS
jgi:hypothetical protein